MKYASIDIETTGLNEQTCQILSVGIVIEDTNNILPFDKIPKLHLVLIEKNIQGEIYALNLNKDLISLINQFHTLDPAEQDELAKEKSVIFTSREFVAKRVNDFLLSNNLYNKLTVAGKNYTGFDLKFLSKLPHWNDLNIHRRVIDPASLFVDWSQDDELPSLELCKQRAGLDNTVVTHNAIEDAFDVIEILRTKY